MKGVACPLDFSDGPGKAAERKRRIDLKEIDVSCISAHDPQLVRLADAIAQRVGQQRFHVWFNNSTRLDLKQDRLVKWVTLGNACFANMVRSVLMAS